MFHIINYQIFINETNDNEVYIHTYIHTYTHAITYQNKTELRT